MYTHLSACRELAPNKASRALARGPRDRMEVAFLEDVLGFITQPPCEMHLGNAGNKLVLDNTSQGKTILKIKA